MQYKIATDSSSNIRSLEGVCFANVPLKIITKEKEYIDDAALDVARMVDELRSYKGTSGTSCPNAFEWLDAFGDADGVFAITITSNLSGCCNAAQHAAQEYMKEHPGRKVCVLDSLSTGPEMRLIAERIRGGILAGRSFEEIEADVRRYMQHTHLLFTLQSLNNLARNGRVSPAVAKIAGVLGICVVGRASDVGTLQPMHKCRGEKRAIRQLWDCMLKLGYSGGRVRIRHTENPDAAQRMAEEIRSAYPDAEIRIGPNRGLCSFYAEKGGVLVGFESDGEE